MKTRSVLFFIGILFIISCKKEDPVTQLEPVVDVVDSTNIKALSDTSTSVVKYNMNNYLAFSRMGGGSNQFKLYLSENGQKVKACVTSYDFKDTVFDVYKDRNAEYETAFADFEKAIKKQIAITGDYKAVTDGSQGYAGTWAYLSFVTDSGNTEVTNIELRESLFRFETYIFSDL